MSREQPSRSSTVFITHFKNETKNIIQEAKDNKIYLPVLEPDQQPVIENEQSIPDDTAIIELELFITQQKSLLHLLSAQEVACLKYAALGKTAKETAQILNLSFRTVESYFENIKTKLHCKQKREAVELFLSDNT